MSPSSRSLRFVPLLLVAGCGTELEELADLLFPGREAERDTGWDAPTIGLDTRTGTIFSESRRDGLGRAVALADVTGDGMTDVFVGSGATGAYVVEGPIVGDVEVGADHLAEMYGDGLDAVALGDLDGDGLADLLVGASAVGSGGEAWWVRAPVEGSMAAADFDVRVVGDDGRLGDDRACVGSAVVLFDLDGDALADPVVSAPGHDEVHVFTGEETGDLDAVDAPVTFEGEQDGDGTGVALLAADLDGDGVGDLAIGAPHAASEGGAGGAVFLQRGPVTEGGTLADADARLGADQDNAYAGGALASGDLDGDGATDLLVGAPRSNDDGGVVYVLTDVPFGVGALTDAATRVLGTDDHQLGYAFSVGDLDGDGAQDVALHANTSDLSEEACWVRYGPLDGTLTPADMDLAIVGDEATYLPGGSAVGDVDGDGIGDLLLEAESSVEEGTTMRGGALAVFGGASWATTDAR